MRVSELGWRTSKVERVGKPGSWPRVTAILQGAGLVDTSFFTPEMALRGTAVHLACQHLDEGTLDESLLPLDVKLRLDSYKKFKKEMDPRIHAIEQEVRHEALRYAGRLDRIVEMGGYAGVLDLKGPAKAPWQGLQLAGYRACVDWTPKRWTLHLSDSGYQLIEHTSEDDWPAFCAALTLLNWKANHG